MARLQRKKPIGAKKKKLDSETATSGVAAVPVKSPNKPAVSSTSKKASMPAKRGGGTTKSASDGKIKGIIDQSIQFLREVKVELKKVAWPSKKQTIGSTAVVLILVFIISAFLGIVDMGLSSLVRLVLQ